MGVQPSTMTLSLKTLFQPLFYHPPSWTLGLGHIDKEMKNTPGGDPGVFDKLTMEVYVLEALRGGLGTHFSSQ